MSGGENIRRLMEATGVYQLTGTSPVDWELDAYAAGLALVEDAMEELEAELFIANAPARRLDQWELLLRPQWSTATLEERREALLKAFSAHTSPANLSAMGDILTAAGVKGTVQEEEGKLVITVEGYQGVTAREAQRMLDRLLPSHIEWEIAAS